MMKYKVFHDDHDHDDGEHSGSGGAGSTSAAKQNYTVDQIADYLTTGFWSDVGQSARKFDVSTGGTLTYSVAGIEAAGVWFVEKAFEAWSAVTGINFVRNDSTGADIVFGDDDSGAYAWSTFDSPGIIGQSFVNVSTGWYYDPNPVYGFDDRYDLHSYSYQTYVHEIGHALGLGHSGNYDGSASYGADAHYRQDSWQMTIMSYFAQTENTDIDASLAFVLTPMAADIKAIQNLYGVPTDVNADATTYGFNSNAEGPASQFASLAGGHIGTTMTVFDTSGLDTFDFSGSSQNQKIDLQDGAISDVLGYKGNLIIASGVTIENAIGGDGADLILGNDATNVLSGGMLADTLAGMAGNDQLLGGKGADILKGGQGADELRGGKGNDQLLGGRDDDSFVGGDGADLFNGGDGIDIVDYSGRTTSVVADLLNTSNVADESVGERFISVENVVGGQSDDVLRGTEGDNSLQGGEGADSLYGRNGHDSLIGGADADYLAGGKGRDQLEGGTGEDQLFGRKGYDDLQGGEGDDILFGGMGNDILVGGDDNDLLTGGQGADRFIFNDGTDRIHDFDATQADQIEIDNTLFGGGLTAEQVLDTYGSVVNGNTHIDFGSGDVLIVEGVADRMDLVDHIVFY